MAKKKITVETAETSESVIVPQPPELLKYRIISAEVKTGAFYIFENIVHEMILKGYKPAGGVDVKTISVTGWLLTQAMIKE